MKNKLTEDIYQQVLHQFQHRLGESVTLLQIQRHVNRSVHIQNAPLKI